jgi:hypothetical protein
MPAVLARLQGSTCLALQLYVVVCDVGLGAYVHGKFCAASLQSQRCCHTSWHLRCVAVTHSLLTVQLLKDGLQTMLLVTLE